MRNPILLGLFATLLTMSAPAVRADDETAVATDEAPVTEDGTIPEEVVEDPANQVELESGGEEGDRKKRLEDAMQKWKDASPEEREKMKAERRERWQSLDPEQKKEIARRFAEGWKELPPERKKEILERLKERRGEGPGRREGAGRGEGGDRGNLRDRIKERREKKRERRGGS